METQAFFVNIREQIQVQLSAARMEIDLAVAWFTDRTLFDLICEKAKNGVAVRLLIFDDDINKSLPIDNLQYCGGKVFRVSDRTMHNKFCVIDRAVVITGSYNWTNKARNENHENITVIKDYSLALQYLQEFNKIVETHCVEETETTTDYKQIIKRLELMKQLIELGDTDELASPYRKLKALNLPKEITDILKLIETQRYKDASLSITDFISRFKDACDYSASGDTKYNSKNYEAAILDYDKAIELYPVDTSNYIKRGNSKKKIYASKGEITNFDKMINVCRSNITLSMYLHHLVSIKIKQGDCKGALAEYDKAIELNPNTEYYFQRGIIKNSLGDYKGAIADFNTAIWEDHDVPEYYETRGIVKDTLGDFKGAVEDFDKASELDINYSFCNFFRDISKMNLNCCTKGVTIGFGIAIELKPEYAKYYGYRADFKYQSGDYKGAIADYGQSIELDPKNSSHYYYRGEIKEYTFGDYQNAIVDYDKAIEIDKGNCDYYFNRGKCKYNIRDYKGAIVDYDRCIALQSGVSYYYDKRGDAKIEFGDYKGALADYDKFIMLETEYLRNYSHRSDFNIDDYNSAIEDYRKAIELKPKKAIAYNQTARSGFDFI